MWYILGASGCSDHYLPGFHDSPSSTRQRCGSASFAAHVFYRALKEVDWRSSLNNPIGKIILRSRELLDREYRTWIMREAKSMVALILRLRFSLHASSKCSLLINPLLMPATGNLFVVTTAR